MNKIIRFNPQLELLVFPDTGRGLASTIKLKAGDSLIKIPLTSIITKQLIQQKLKNESIQFLTETQALVLFILDQILNSDEEYMEYIATLPTHFNTLPLTYPLELQSYFDAELLLQQDTLEKDEKTIRFHSQVVFSKKQFKYAWLAINTRCIHTTKQIVLIPFLDMLNHSSQPIQTKLSWDTFEIITTQDYEIGDQVFINYGRHSNSFLLLEYGFIGEFSKELDYVNLNDVCMNLLSTNKREECAKRGMKECVCQFESIGWIMKCVLMLVCSEENELSAWIDVWDGITDSISLENDIKWKELAMKILYEAIDSTEKKVKQVESLKDASDCTLMTSRCDMILKMLKYQLIITKSIKL